MLKAALTGGIASGKSAVLQFFNKKGIPTIDCDAIVRKLYKSKEVQKRLRSEFGTSNRKKIASIIFSSSAKRKQLEAIMHPLILNELWHKMSEFESQGKSIVIADIPLLFELRLEKRFDTVIVVSCSKQKQLQRLIKQGLTKKDALKRIKAQMPLARKIKKADFVIDNSKSLDAAKKQAEKILSELNG